MTGRPLTYPPVLPDFGVAAPQGFLEAPSLAYLLSQQPPTPESRGKERLAFYLRPHTLHLISPAPSVHFPPRGLLQRQTKTVTYISCKKNHQPRVSFSAPPLPSPLLLLLLFSTYLNFKGKIVRCHFVFENVTFIRQFPQKEKVCPSGGLLVIRRQLQIAANGPGDPFCKKPASPAA